MKILLYNNLWQNDKTELLLYHSSTHFYILYFLPHNAHFFPWKIPSNFITLHLNTGWWTSTYKGYDIHKVSWILYSASYKTNKTGHTIQFVISKLYSAVCTIDTYLSRWHTLLLGNRIPQPILSPLWHRSPNRLPTPLPMKILPLSAR
jgi:hypothetical protein